jgi:DNA-binding CsgD family transcriptional regulator/photosystem II stability/assembly factor-like uncharacterized protein
MRKRGRPRYPDVLTPREWEVLSLLRENLTNEQIAERLGVTLHAARYHVSEILSKLGVATREEAAAWQPEPVRAGPHWSLAFQIWLTAAAAVAVIAVGVLAWGVARGSGDDEQAVVIPSASPTFIPSNIVPTITATPSPPGFGDVIGTPPVTGPNVLGMQLMDDGFAVLLADDKLYTTELIPFGEKIEVQEADITPPGFAPAEIKGFHFLDHDHGWVVAAGRVGAQELTEELVVLRTTDGGQSWQSSTLAEAAAVYFNTRYNPAYIDFLDQNRGWVVINTTQTGNSDSGELYRTDDGGATWTKLSIPIGSAAQFSDTNNGIVAGGIARDRLFVTHDGGESWKDVSDITPLAEPAGPRAFGKPMTVNDGRLLLPVTMAIENQPSLFILYSSTDGGDSWRQLALTPIGDGVTVGVPLLSHIFPDGRIVGIPQDGVRGLVLASGPTQFLEFQVNGLSGATAIDFANNAEGWALVTESGCRSFKSDCWSVDYIEQTDDGGHTWYPR